VADRGSRAGRVRRWLPVWLAVGFVVLQLAGFSQEPPFADTYRYAVKAQRIAGVPATDAHERAVRVLCERWFVASDRARALDPYRRFRTSAPPVRQAVERCLSENPDTYGPSDPRYVAIFEARPGYPLLVAPFVAVFGLKWGLLIPSWLIGAAGGLLVFLLLRLAGVGRMPALTGQVLYYVLPIGYWAARTLTEGAMLLGTLGVVIGCWLLVTRRVRRGQVIAAAGYGSTFLVKYSQVPMLAAGLLVAAVVIWLVDRRSRHRGTVLAGVTSGVALLGGLSVPALLGWPGLDESLQDTFTNHFHNGPDVADPVIRLAKMNRAIWPQLLMEQAIRPLLLVALAAALWALWRWSRPLALIVSAAAATGVATEIAHPMWVEGDRLYTQIWLAAVVGLPAGLHLLARRRTAVRCAPTARASSASASSETFRAG
jgi:hypothetical protein